MREGIFPQTTLSVTTSYRPKRVAFLISPEDTTEAELNEIFQYCYTVWGGGFNVIIPSTSKEILPDWWKWLVSFDPDIVYSFLPLDDVLIDRINRHILPSKIIEVAPERKQQGQFLINPFDIEALGIEDIPLYTWTTRGYMSKDREPLFLYIKESFQENPHKTFILRNFGILPDNIRGAFSKVPCKFLDGKEISAKSILGQLKMYASQVILPSDHCKIYGSPYFGFKYERHTEGYHLVVGDSPLDTIYYWNHATNSYPGRGRNIFWLSETQCADAELIGLVGEWIIRTYWRQERFGKIISYSVDEDKLKALAGTIQEIVKFHFKPIRFNPDQFLYFSDTPTNKIGMVHHTDQVSLSENRGLVGFQRPKFLLKGHSQFGWMVDLEIQYHPERYAIFTNVRPNWQLPKRLGLAQKFFDYKPESRIVKGGQVSVAVTTEDRAIKFKVPSDLDVVWTYLDKHYSNVDRKRPLVKARFTDLYISDKGRYLQGLLRLFDSIHGAGSFFEDPFWRHILLLMAGARNSQGETLTYGRIKDRFGELRGKALKEDSKDKNYWQTYDRFDDFKESELRDLIDKRVLLQGVDLRCPHCYTSQWCVVDDLGTEMRCSGCLSDFPLPTAPEWSFRLNDLVGNALRKHGTLVVLQTLYRLQQFKDMFLYLPCQDIFEKDKKECFTDLDIVVVTDEKFIIGEVKSATAGFKAKDFEKLLEVAKELLPDQVLLAAPGDTWPEEIEFEIKKFSDALVPFQVKVVPYLLQW